MIQQQSLLALLSLVASLALTAHGFIPCDDPSAHVGSYVASSYAISIGLGQECAALVQNNCHRQPGNKEIGVTSSWVRGINVHTNCASIPTLTAIATFLGANNAYNEANLHQHTAIFVGCETAGIRVWDQWKGTPLASRVIPWTSGSSIQYTGNNFYTIAD